mmetsp:Transcript_65466/g.175084  ORF Transcript_65466/g.175084 Transcript_65466/m.175084 type:complete len:277 (+) Transcript_65466:323-1153(+)
MSCTSGRPARRARCPGPIRARGCAREARRGRGRLPARLFPCGVAGWPLPRHRASSSQLAELRLVRQVHDAPVERRVQEACDGEHAAHDRADLHQEVGHALLPLLVPDGHGGEVVPQVQRGHLLVDDLVRVRGELIHVQRWPVQWNVRGRHDFRVVFEDGRIYCECTRSVSWRHHLVHAVQRVHDARALKVLGDITDVRVGPERDVVDVVRNVHVLCLLVQGPEEVRVAVGGEVHVPRHFVHLHKAGDAAPLAAVDHPLDAVHVLVVVAEAEVPRQR